MTKEEIATEKEVRSFMAYIPETASAKDLRRVIELIERDRVKLRNSLLKTNHRVMNVITESNQILNKMEGILYD